MKWRILILSAISLFFTACQVQENIQDGQTAYKLKKYISAISGFTFTGGLEIGCSFVLNEKQL